MVVITKTKLIDFYEGESRAKESLLRWYHEVVLCDWKDFHEIKQTFNAVDSVGNDRYVFNVAGNRYRVVAMIHFSTRTMYIRFVGTHKEYDKINCKTV